MDAHIARVGISNMVLGCGGVSGGGGGSGEMNRRERIAIGGARVDDADVPPPDDDDDGDGDPSTTYPPPPAEDTVPTVEVGGGRGGEGGGRMDIEDGTTRAAAIDDRRRHTRRRVSFGKMTNNDDIIRDDVVVGGTTSTTERPSHSPIDTSANASGGRRSTRRGDEHPNIRASFLKDDGMDLDDLSSPFNDDDDGHGDDCEYDHEEGVDNSSFRTARGTLSSVEGVDDDDSFRTTRDSQSFVAYGSSGGDGRRIPSRKIRQPSLRATFLKVDANYDEGPSSDILENDDVGLMTTSTDDVNVSRHPLDYISEAESSSGTKASSFHAVDFSHHWSSRRTSMITHTSTVSLSPHDMAANAAISVRDDFVNDLPPSLREDYDNRDVVAPFRTNEIILGKMLGSGEFSHVYEISKFRPMDADGLGEMEIAARRRMKSRERYRETNRCTYAVKHLRPTLLERYTDEQYAQAARDVALEAIFLNSLSDPNIIKLRGISFAGPGGFTQGPKGFFLIIDRLNETLGDRIKRWTKASKRNSSLSSTNAVVSTIVDSVKGLVGLGKATTPMTRSVSNCNDGSQSSMGSSDDKGIGGVDRSILEDQLDVGLQISSALMYLHEKGIMFRDLKPANVGFDVRGDVKLFDFGLATLMPQNGDPYEDRFVMSGAGSPRYMAPEVLVDPPDKYNMKADVYSFGIVLWQMFSLTLPFSHVRSKSEMVDIVVVQGARPTINEEWRIAIKVMLRQSFDANSANRPTMLQFFDMLRLQLIEIRDGDATDLNSTHIKRRRSHQSMLNINKQQRGGRRTQNFVPQIAKGANAIISAVKPTTYLSSEPRKGLNNLRNKMRSSLMRHDE